MKIIKAIVLLRDGADMVSLFTSHPSPMPKVTSQCLILDFSTEINTGAEYVRKVFKIEPEIITTRNKQ